MLLILRKHLFLNFCLEVADRELTPVSISRGIMFKLLQSPALQTRFMVKLSVTRNEQSLHVWPHLSIRFTGPVRKQATAQHPLQAMSHPALGHFGHTVGPCTTWMTAIHVSAGQQ